jgi:PAS domain S-box-containing protein
MDLAISHLPHGDKALFVAVVRDISERKRGARSLACQHAVTAVLAESLSLEDAVPRILRSVSEALSWDFGAFWSVDPGKNVLRCAQSWSAAPDLVGGFQKATEALSFPRGAGLPGRAWSAGTVVWSYDVQQDPQFLLSVEAKAAGLHAAFAAPVALGSEVLGVLEFFSRSPEESDHELIEIFQSLGSQIAQFIERAAADKAFRANDERTRAVVENMLEGLIMVDERGIIQSVNPAAEQMFGYAAWELAGHHIKMLLPQNLLGRAKEFLRDARIKSLGRITEWDGRRKNGNVFRFELSLFELQTPEGRYLAGHMRDISERRELERMKREFVATVSHELRTPLTSIRGSLGLLSGGVLGDLPDEAKDVVGIAERNTIRLITLINDILDLERLEAGRMEIHLDTVPVAQVLERSVEAVKAFAEQQGVSLEAPSTAATIFVDGDRIVQVLVNLLSNAIKFSPKGSVVSVSVHEEPEVVEIRVRDHGRGIPADHQESIFERFKQVEASDARGKGGTGLGLAICRAILEQHGGSIGVRSETGKGSTFFFRLPARPPRALDRFLAAIHGSSEASGPGGVLLVDDDEALLGVMVRQLLQDGISVRTAQTGKDAIRLATAQPPALLVIDVGLPDQDAFAVLSTLRKYPALKDIPVLVYTGVDLSAEERDRLSLGPTRFLTKSRASDAEFRGLVAELLRTSSAGSKA